MNTSDTVILSGGAAAPESKDPVRRSSAEAPAVSAASAGKPDVILSGGAAALESKDPVRRSSAQGASAFDAVEGAVGLGVDIVEIARMRAILQRTPSFRTRVFSEEERAYCDATANPEVHYATRFAAKEAVLKALGTGFSQGIGARDVEVRRNAKGRPSVVLHGRAKEVATDLGVREVPLSLSYTHTDAVACAMAITESSIRVQEERVNPMEELAKRFKEARGMLDELDAPKPQEPRSSDVVA